MRRDIKNQLTLWILFPAMLLIGFWLLIGLCRQDTASERATRTTASAQEQLENRLQEQAIGGDALRRLSAHMQYRMGKSQIGDVYVTASRMLEAPDEPDTDALLQTAQQINTFYQESQLPICLIAAPCATQFYQDQLPEGAPFSSQKESLHQFYDALHLQIQTVDPYSVLIPVQDDYIFYRTDSRWTSYGAYCVYRSAMQKMGFLPVSYDNCIVSHVYGSYRGDLYQNCFYSGVTPDILDQYSILGQETTVTGYEGIDKSGKEHDLYDWNALKQEDPYQFYLGKATPLLTLETSIDNEKSLLVLKDSWANCMVPFLAEHFQTIYLLDVTCADEQDAALLQSVTFDQILMLCDLEAYENTDVFQKLLTAMRKETEDD